MISTLEKIPAAEFRIEDVRPGTKVRLELIVDSLPDGQPLVFSTVIVRGSHPGKTLLTTGGVHGDEYEGPVAIQDVFEELDPQSLHGTFAAIPILNTPAYTAATREGGWDHQNLARIFPGNPTGTMSERIANAFATYILGQSDFYADLHAGGNAYQIQRFAGYQILDSELNRLQRAAAIAWGFDLVWGTAALPGRSLSAARECGVPAIYVEMPGEGRCRPEDREMARQGLRNLLSFLTMLPGDFPTTPPEYCFETNSEGAGHLQIDHPSPASGLFVPAVTVWDSVEKGQTLGEIRHPNGSVLAKIPSQRAGRVLFLRTLPRVFAGDFLVFVLELPAR
ncbi:MAG: M14 family metallopeptidase [Fuerstiella sp.]|nr:M14 family metallopeptidase [Fuerstiella sp.]